MVSRLALVGHLMGETPLFNCKSGKDRTGQLDAEVKSLAAADESGGRVPPPDESMETWRPVRSMIASAASKVRARRKPGALPALDPAPARPVALLDVSPEAEDLARRLLDLGAVPREAAADAAHIAIAVTSGVEYLVTWNFRHIANAAMRVRIERTCREAGYEPPVICTPNELMETGHADDGD